MMVMKVKKDSGCLAGCFTTVMSEDVNELAKA